jgi:sugar lactone lactonase YvrE
LTPKILPPSARNPMKNYSRFCLALLSLLSLIAISCSDDDPGTGIPEVASISPSEGPKSTVVVISGSNFSTTISDNEITFNGKAAVISKATASQLTVAVPAAADSGPVIVKTKGQAAVNQPQFKYQWSVSTVAGTTMGYADGAAAKFNTPTGISVDANGNMYVTDFLNSVIRKISATGEVSTLAGSERGYLDGPANTARFSTPNGSAVDHDGNIYVTDETGGMVRKISSNGYVSTLAGSGVPTFGDGTGAAAHFSGPSGIAIDLQGNLFIADQFNHKVRKVSPAGVVTTLAGSIQGYNDGTGGTAQFFRPTGVVVDEEGNVFVADLFNHKIRKITSAGVVTTVAGNTAGFADGLGPAAKFNFPAGLAIDKQGNLYVADSDNHRIRKITPQGEVSTFAGTGAQGTNDGIATASQFSGPRELDIDAEGVVYVVDAAGHRVRKID